MITIGLQTIQESCPSESSPAVIPLVISHISVCTVLTGAFTTCIYMQMKVKVFVVCVSACTCTVCASVCVCWCSNPCLLQDACHQFWPGESGTLDIGKMRVVLLKKDASSELDTYKITIQKPKSVGVDMHVVLALALIIIVYSHKFLK